MKHTPRIHLAALALLAPSVVFAARITEADLANDPLPLSVLTVTGGSRTGQYAGAYSDVLDEADNKRILFKLSELSTDTGCSVSFTLAGTQHFNTYALRVAHSTQYDNVNRGPKKWEVWGSTDNANWTLLSTEENQTGWQFADNGGGSAYGQAASPGETRFYRFSTNNRYSYIRFKFYESNGDANYILVTRIVLYTSSATAETFAGCEDLVPASTPANASRYTSTTHPQNNDTYFTIGNVATAFSDDDPARIMMKNVANGVANLIYEFGTDDKKVVNGYMVRFPNDQNSTPSRAPYAWTFAGSNDGSNWTSLDERDGQTGWEKNEKRYYAFENHNAYAYYKIEFTANNGEDRDEYYYEFGNLDYYFRQPDGFFFTALDASYSDGVFTVSGALTADSVPADVTLTMVTNGLPFVIDFGTVQPGGTFSTNVPFASGVIGGMLTGMAGSHTNSIVEGPVYIPGADAARTRFVAPNGNDENAGTSLAAPMLHIADAVASLGNDGGTVFVLPGTYVETNDFTAVEIAAPVSVIGVTGNPADATVTQNATYHFARIFKLTHSSALLRGLTITGGKVMNEPKANGSATAATANVSPYTDTVIVNGGNILMSDGLVENCIISNGHAARYASFGGNVWMSGGRLSCCVLVGGIANRDYLTDSANGAGSIFASGGVVENCLIRDCSGGAAPLCADGTSKFVNCTVVGNTSRGCGGFIIAGNNSQVINTVIFGNVNRGGSGKDPWFNPEAGTCNIYIASKFKNKVPTNPTEAFVNCATDGETAINGTCRLIDATAFAGYANGDYAPAPPDVQDLPASPLVNKGVNYATYGGVSTTDLVGNPRIWGPVVDIGAYECQYKPVKGILILFQ